MDSELDRDIAGAFQVIGLLLVFVSAFFSYTWPRTLDLLGAPWPPDGPHQDDMVKDLRRQRALFVMLGILILPILALLTPLAVRVMRNWSWFDSVRLGLVAVIAFLLLAVSVIARLVVRLSRKIAEYPTR